MAQAPTPRRRQSAGSSRATSRPRSRGASSRPNSRSTPQGRSRSRRRQPSDSSGGWVLYVLGLVIVNALLYIFDTGWIIY